MAAHVEQGGWISSSTSPQAQPGLPTGWEELWDDNLKKSFYVDHNTQTTTVGHPISLLNPFLSFPYIIFPSVHLLRPPRPQIPRQPVP